MMKIEYRPASIADLSVVFDETGVKRKVQGIKFNGEVHSVTDRFWTSVCSRFGFNPSVFRYFDHAEVFQRIADKQKGGAIGLTIEKTIEPAVAADEHNDFGVLEKVTSRLLGVSSPTKPVANYQNLVDTLTSYGAEDIKYAGGIITSQHTPRVDNGFSAAGDQFKSKFFLATPIDGYGSPSTYLGLLRLACSNGMVAMSKAFKSDLNIGKGEDNVMPAIVRALDSFNNDEGFAALQERIESSTKSWASIYEANSLQQLLYKCFLQSDMEVPRLNSTPPAGTRLAKLFPTGKELDAYKKIGHPIFKAFHSMTGDTSMIYGLANLDALSQKRQRALPVKCSTYELMNFATEVATHYANPTGARKLYGWMGEVISNEYDMENTMETNKDFADFHIKSHLDIVTESISSN